MVNFHIFCELMTFSELENSWGEFKPKSKLCLFSRGLVDGDEESAPSFSGFNRK